MLISATDESPYALLRQMEQVEGQLMSVMD